MNEHQRIRKNGFVVVLTLFSSLFLVSCGGGENFSSLLSVASSLETSISSSDGKSAVLYFSCTSNTQAIADKITANLACFEVRIVPKEAYTAADLDYRNSTCRANKEQNDPTARPAIENTIDISPYSTFFLGYPIWWGTLPKIIDTLCDTYDFSGRTIIPFCTSVSSGIETSVVTLKALEPEATILSGRRFSASATQSDVDSWIAGLGLVK